MLAGTITDRNGNQMKLTGAPAATANGYVDTLGRTVVAWSGLGASAGDTVTVAGLSSPITVHWTSVTGALPAGSTSLTGPCTLAGSTVSYPAVSEIDLPNGQKYTFQYDNPDGEDPYGLLRRINYPGGGYVRYAWGLNLRSQANEFAPVEVALINDSGTPGTAYTQECILTHDAPAVSDRYLSVDGVHEVLHQHFDYATAWDTNNDGYWTTKTTTVTTTDLGTGQVTKTVYTYGWVATPNNIPFESDHRMHQVPVESEVEYEDGNGAVLRTVKENWANVREQTGRQTVLDNGQTSTELRCYNADEQVAEADAYGFAREGAAGTIPGCASTSGLQGVGPLERRTVTAWHDFMAASPATHITNEPDSVTVYDGQGNMVQQTTYSYDGGTLQASGTTTGLGAPPGERGNLTALARWVNPGNTWLTANYAWDDAGQLASQTDPGGHTTRYTWGDAVGGPGGTDGFLLAVQYPDTSSPDLAHHVESYTWDYPSGHLLSHTGQNPGETTRYAYADPLGRLTDIQVPDGGETKVSYSDTPGNLYTEIQRKIDGTRWTDAFTWFDGLGRAVTACSANDEATPWDRSDTQYDGEGRMRFRSYPYQAADCTGPNGEPGDTFAYDALGRPLTVTHSDSSQIGYSYQGAATEVQDEGNGSTRVTHVLQHDGLGRLASVCEADGETGAGPNSTPGACSNQIPGFAEDLNLTGFETGYRYDALGDLTQVQQPGLEDRSFSYDSLGRLRSAGNPETGTVGYSYDADGNVVSKTDARGLVTTMSYDALERRTSEYFSDDPQQQRRVVYDYDQLSVPGFNFGAGIGHLTQEWVGLAPAEQRNYAWDARGRLTATEACTPSNCGQSGFWIQAGYDLLGDETSLSYPDGRVVATSYNRAGRATAVTGTSFAGQATTIAYLSGAQYTAAGQPLTLALGNGVTDSFGYDGRGRLNARGAGGAETWLSRALSRAPDEAVTASADRLSGARSQSYTYDPLNRLATAAAGGWSLSWAYDRQGNRWQQTGTQAMLLTFSGQNNRPDADGTWSFDTAGELTGDGRNTYCYDAQGQLLTVVAGVNQDCASASPLASYAYDAQGEPVMVRVDGANTDTLWWRGERLAERAGPLASPDWSDDIYAGGRRLARADTFENRLSISGQICSGCVNAWSIYELGAGWWSSYVIQPGDTLWLRQQQNGGYGGLKLFFQGGADTNWRATDQAGQYLNDDHNQSGWHTRRVDLSGWAGQTLTVIDLVQEADSPPGYFNLTFKDIVLVSADGTVRPIYSGQPTVAITGAGGSAGVQRWWGIEHGIELGGDADLTTWFHADQVGTTRLLTNSAGYPDWQGSFLPFGEELQPQPAVTNVKFTGQPRDEETGLDNFPARSYASALGRWMTPDWSAKAEPVPYAKLDNPQSLNLYTYVLNNPVSSVDPDGHCCLADEYLNSVEVSLSLGLSEKESLQIGPVGESEELNLGKVMASSGLAGGNHDLDASAGANMSLTLGPVGGKAEIGVKASTRDGLGAKAAIQGSLPGVSHEIGIDQNGKIDKTDIKGNKDTTIGASAALGIGVGVSINLTKLGKAISDTVAAAQQIVNSAKEHAFTPSPCSERSPCTHH